MKKITITLTFVILISQTLFSQENKIGLTLQVSNPIRDVKVGWFDVDMESLDNYNVKENSFALGILGSYKVSMTSLRLRLNYTKIGIKEYHDQYFDGVRSEELAKGNQNKITLAPGISWTTNKEKLDIYVGLEVPITIHGKFDMSFESVQTDSISGTLVTGYSGQSEIPSGYSVGIGGILGFNYFLSPKFSVGAEFSPSILYSNLGGDVKQKSFTAVPPQTGSGISEDEFKGYTHYENRFSFGISLWF